ncbi:MAG: phosphate signaling complex PhoU family protein [Candidatus Njordarchaeales archaeon]
MLQKELEALKNMLFEISRYAKESIVAAIEYLRTGSDNYLEQVREFEKKSDFLNLDVFEKCVAIIARQQPVAKDLRFVLMAFNISSFYERICDISLEVCELGKAELGDKLKDHKLDEIERVIIWMVKRVITMIEINEDSLRRENIRDLKSSLESIDNEIDSMFQQAINTISEYVEKGLLKAREAISLALILRHIERIGDIVAKTGSRIVYVEKGSYVWIK